MFAVLRFLLNGFFTSRRMQDTIGPCVFGCCSEGNEDSLEHYAMCPRLNAVARWCGFLEERSDWGWAWVYGKWKALEEDDPCPAVARTQPCHAGAPSHALNAAVLELAFFRSQNSVFNSFLPPTAPPVPVTVDPVPPPHPAPLPDLDESSVESLTARFARWDPFKGPTLHWAGSSPPPPLPPLPLPRRAPVLHSPFSPTPLLSSRIWDPLRLHFQGLGVRTFLRLVNRGPALLHPQVIQTPILLPHLPLLIPLKVFVGGQAEQGLPTSIDISFYMIHAPLGLASALLCIQPTIL